MILRFETHLGYPKQKIHCVFNDVSKRVVLLSRHKNDVKEDITLLHDVNKKTLNSYIGGIMQILLIQSEICHTFLYHVNVILKLTTEFVTELVETVHFFSIIINFVFSLQIHFSP